MSQAITTQVAAVTITDAAAQEFKRALAQQEKADYGLRVSVMAGGCSGYSYGLNFEPEPAPTDSTFKANGVRVFIDQDDLALLKGIEIDFASTMMGGGFRINNPNAASTCGCGSSFG